MPRLVKTKARGGLLPGAPDLELFRELSHWCCLYLWPHEPCWEVTSFSPGQTLALIALCRGMDLSGHIPPKPCDVTSLEVLIKGKNL